MGQRPRAKPKDLAAKLQAVRRKLELSQSRMARLIGMNVSPARLSEYESGLREPNLMVLLRYSELARVHMEKLVDDRLELTFPKNLKKPHKIAQTMRYGRY